MENCIKLITKIKTDDITKKFSNAFDYKFNGESTFYLPKFDLNKKDFQIGVIYGSSGSGKTQILKNYFDYKKKDVVWEKDKAIVSHFVSFEEACERCFAVGLSSIPTLLKPYFVLSNGEAHRADIARQLESNACIDEFTSTVNREVAFSLSKSISKYIRKTNIKNIVIATCHCDIINWLEPTWTFCCDSSSFEENEIDFANLERVGKIEIY